MSTLSNSARPRASQKVNKIIKILISSDLVLNSGWGLLAPVFAIFILKKITLDDVAAAAKIAGFASLIYWLVKSSLQIPVGRYLDKNHGEKDDFWFLVGGLFLSALVPFGFIFASYAWHIYTLQVIHAVGMAMALPSWCAIFTRHIDKGREAFEWGIESTSLGLGAGIGGAFGGIIAATFGFEVIFISITILTFFSGGLLFFISKDIEPQQKKQSHVPVVRLPL